MQPFLLQPYVSEEGEASDDGEDNGQGRFPPGARRGSENSPATAESLPGTATADTSSHASPSSAPGSCADAMVKVESGDSEAAAKAEDMEPSREVARAAGSRADPFAADSPMLAGDAESSITPEVPIGKGEDTALAGPWGLFSARGCHRWRRVHQEASPFSAPGGRSA